ncbi:MAG: HDOD domain-containing protein [Planctomycetes bacterium]|nr:HDOD domain-containing protein [Planctomycetota bacterium]
MPPPPQQPGNNQERLKRAVDKVVGLPTLPAMLASINRLMINPRTSAKEVAALISSDPAITAKILRVVNSSFYGFPNRITTITHAIVILGFNTIKSIVLSSSIFDAFKKGAGKPSPYNRTEFWKHSVGCGVACKVIARRIGYSSLEEFFIAGLLHDIGKVVMDQYLHDDFLQVLEIVGNRNCLIVDAESQHLGFTHADIGGWLFQKWNLSKALIESTTFHHNPALASENQKPVSVVHLADIMIRAMGIGSGGDARIPMVSEAAWQLLDIPPSALDKLVAEIDEEMQRALVFLELAG